MITAVSSIANKGVYIKPRIVKSIQNSTTGEITEMPIETGERIISKENAEKVLSMMNSVVSEGTGKMQELKGIKLEEKQEHQKMVLILENMLLLFVALPKQITLK